MPSKSKKQVDFMRAAAHNPQFAKRAGVKPSVAKEFYRADKKKNKRFQMGGLAQATAPARASYRTQGPSRGGVIPGKSRNGLLGAVSDHLGRSQGRLSRLNRGLRPERKGKF